MNYAVTISGFHATIIVTESIQSEVKVITFSW